MKKYIFTVICLMLAATLLTACSDGNTATSGNGKLKIVTTIFPEYDWVREIAGEKADITMLLNNGVDLHSYQPTVDDIVKISDCDMFLYVGGESDKWVQDALAEAVNKKMVVINLLEILGDAAKEEEITEGMESEDEEYAEYDEHVWLSLRNAEIFCKEIANKLSEIDSKNAGYYLQNSTEYIEKLRNLDAKYRETAENADVKTLIFGDRFPFRYMVDDYGISYYAAFAGCGAETEASFETVIFLANKTDELGLNAIMQTESSDGAVARTVKENTISKSQKILTLDSMQSITLSDVENGVTYLSLTEKNLEVLKEALEPR